jgi:hypothetical protein
VIGYRLVVRSALQTGYYHKDMGEVFYDRHNPETIYWDFIVKKPLNEKSVSLKNSIKTCSCVVLKLEKETLLPGESANIRLGIHPDMSSSLRHEEVIFKTGTEEIPIIQLSLSALTTPNISIDVSQCTPLKLADGAKVCLNISGTTYLSSNEDANSFSFETDGIGILLKDQNRIIQKHSANLMKLVIQANIEINCDISSLKGYPRIPVSVTFGNKDRRQTHKFYWIPVYPFLLSHYQIFLNANFDEQRFIEIIFDEITTITKLCSKNSSVNLNLTSLAQEKNHRISVALVPDMIEKEEENTMLDEIEIYVNNEDIPIVTIPVFILK